MTATDKQPPASVPDGAMPAAKSSNPILLRSLDEIPEDWREHARELRVENARWRRLAKQLQQELAERDRLAKETPKPHNTLAAIKNFIERICS